MALRIMENSKLQTPSFRETPSSKETSGQEGGAGSPASSLLPPACIGWLLCANRNGCECLKGAASFMHTIARLFRNSFHQVHSGNDSSRAALWLLTSLVCCAAPSFAQTVFLNFNSVGQYTNNFNPW